MDTPIELESFRLPDSSRYERSRRKATRRHRHRGMFIRGPISLDWMSRVLSMSGRTPLALAIALWFQSGLERSTSVRLTNKLRRKFGLNSRVARRALSDFESAGLVRVEQQPGQCLVVELLSVHPVKEPDGPCNESSRTSRYPHLNE